MTDLLSTPTPTGPGAPPVRDFTRARKRLVFTIDDDTFEAASVLPGDVYAEFVTRYNGAGDKETYKEQHEKLKDALQLALLPASYELFTRRLADKTNPIDDEQMSEVVLWLLEAYGLRPTQPSQLSLDGSPTPVSGMSSTEQQQAEESTQEVSLPTAS
jgi:hypothetical protein